MSFIQQLVQSTIPFEACTCLSNASAPLSLTYLIFRMDMSTFLLISASFTTPLFQDKDTAFDMIWYSHRISSNFETTAESTTTDFVLRSDEAAAAICAQSNADESNVMRSE